MMRLAVVLSFVIICSEAAGLTGKSDAIKHHVHLTPADQGTAALFQEAARLYSASERVRVRVNPIAAADSVVHVYHPDPDRSCLMYAPEPKPVESKFEGDYTLDGLVQFINHKAVEFINVSGELNSAGKLLQSVNENMFRSNGGQCDRISAKDLDTKRFMRDYVLPQKPVIITDISLLSRAEAVSFLESSLDEKVHVKLSDSKSFEGIEPLSAWTDASGESDGIPDEVLSQLESPDKVVVRAAHADMTLQQVLSHFAASNQRMNQSMHLYVEYFETRSKLQALDKLITSRLPVWAHPLRDGHQYLWLGDGRTVGRLHFDAFDNIMFVVEGAKTFRLIDASDNQRMYEGHMREAQLQLKNGHWRRSQLPEATSMVHTPLEADALDFGRYPLARPAFASMMNCRAAAGEAIYVPSYWWHEVESEPGEQQQVQLGGNTAPTEVYFNMAVNVWYEPVFSKAFPCSNCSKEFNPSYRDLLEMLSNEAAELTSWR